MARVHTRKTIHTPGQRPGKATAWQSFDPLGGKKNHSWASWWKRAQLQLQLTSSEVQKPGKSLGQSPGQVWLPNQVLFRKNHTRASLSPSLRCAGDRLLSGAGAARDARGQCLLLRRASFIRIPCKDGFWWGLRRFGSAALCCAPFHSFVCSLF